MSDDQPTQDRPSGRDEEMIDAARRQAADVTPGMAVEPGTLGMPPVDAFTGYELLREIHRGGQGAVYLALQKATKRKVAIKVMHGGPHAGSAGRARFEREVQILGQLDHPNIVRIHDSGVTADGSFFYVMDYISGRTLEEHVRAAKPGIADMLRLFIKICDGVNAAHLKGVIHRDLKPANVRVDGRGEPVIVDFGLARVAIPDITDDTRPQVMSMTGQFIGSLPWASPEQAEGNPARIDLRTDVYSLGVMLYQMLTGRFPYEVIGQMRDVLDNILRAVPARPSTVRRQINDEVETIVLKCLSKERERRYQTAGELARDIQHYLNGEPIEAKRDSGWYVISKTLRRYRVQVSVFAAFLVLILGSAAGLWVLYQQSREARYQAALNEARVEAEAERAAAAEREARLKGEAADLAADRAGRLRSFLDGILRAVRPDVARGRDEVALAMVDSAGALVDSELGDRPQIAAEMHETIGVTYLALQALDKARVHLNKALEVRRALAGPSHPDTLSALNSVGVLLRNSQMFEEAEAALREAAAGYAQAEGFGPAHPRTLGTLMNLARALEPQRDPAKEKEAATLYRRVIEGLQQASGERTMLAVALMHYGNFLLRGQGDLAEGADVLEQSIEVLSAEPDAANDPNLAKVRLSWARVLDRKGDDPAAAEQAYRDAVGDIRRLMKDTHPDAMASRTIHANFMKRQGRLDEAIAEYRAVVDLAVAGALPEGHPFISHYQGDLGECLLEQARYAEAEPILKASHEAFLSRDPESPGSKLSRERLFDLYTKWGKPDDAARFAPPP